MDKKIEQLESQNIINDDVDIEILKTQQIVLRKLKNIYNKVKDKNRKKMINQYINNIDNIKIYSHNDIAKKYIFIDGKLCCIWDIEDIGEIRDLDSLILNQIINEYDMMD